MVIHWSLKGTQQKRNQQVYQGMNQNAFRQKQLHREPNADPKRRKDRVSEEVEPKREKKKLILRFFKVFDKSSIYP